MHVPDRVYGFEHEFAIVMQDKKGNIYSVPDEYTALYGKPPSASFPTQYGQKRIWHANGGCNYIDTGEHPEHSTPECRSVRDAVLYAKAGEYITAEMFSEKIETGASFLLFKNNLGCNKDGDVDGEFGCHENYLVYGFNPKQKELFVDPFIPFLITRQLLDGAGWWTKSGTYLRSQRAYSIVMETGAGSTSMRSLVHVKDTSDTGPMRRLHLILGDANILETAAYLKIGVTSLVISLLEAHMAPPVSCTFPHRVIKDIARESDPSEPQPGLCYHNDSISPLTAQFIYFDAVSRELANASFDSEETEAECKDILRLWEQALHALYLNDTDWMRGRLDWVTKKYLVDAFIQNMPQSDDAASRRRRKDFDIWYHCISNRTLQHRMNKKWADRRILNDAEIERAMTHAPQNTRAVLRSRFIQLMNTVKSREFATIEWTHCNIGYPASPHIQLPFPRTPLAIHQHEKAIQMPNPLIYESREFEQFMQKLQESFGASNEKLH